MLAARSCEMSHDDYRELVIKCWNKFYTCCLQYEKVMTDSYMYTCKCNCNFVSRCSWMYGLTVKLLFPVYTCNK